MDDWDWQVDLWMSRRPISHKLHTQINSYFTEVWLRHHGVSLTHPQVLLPRHCFVPTDQVRVQLCGVLYKSGCRPCSCTLPT